MKIYDVCYDYLDYCNEHTVIYADNKTEAKKILKRDIGKYAKVNYIDDVTR